MHFEILAETLEDVAVTLLFKRHGKNFGRKDHCFKVTVYVDDGDGHFSTCSGSTLMQFGGCCSKKCLSRKGYGNCCTNVVDHVLSLISELEGRHCNS